MASVRAFWIQLLDKGIKCDEIVYISTHKPFVIISLAVNHI